MTRRNSQQFAKNPVLAFIATLGLMVSQAIPVLAASFNKTGSMNASRQYDTATLLANGAVLVTGGDNFTAKARWLLPTGQPAFKQSGWHRRLR